MTLPRIPTGPPQQGPSFVGGFAFAHDGGSSPEWSSLAPASVVLPELSLSRQADEARMTLNAVVHPDDDAEAVTERLLVRVSELTPAAMPLLDPDPVQRTRVASAAPPSHYEHAVERAVERIRAGDLEKVVLAREVRAHARVRARPGGRLRRPPRAVSRLLLLVRRHAGGRVRRRQPRAAGAPRWPARPDGRPRRHHPT